MNDNKIPYTKSVSIRWADLDPNFHLRHSVYYDFGAQQRIEILYALGLTPAVMKEQHFGPVIFREECIFRREIKFADEVTITAKLSRLTPDASRWTIQHELLSPDQKLLATLTVEGAWIDTNLRKLASPTPEIVRNVFNALPKSSAFSVG
jgi:acyl-CoA thioester hydrolase